MKYKYFLFDWDGSLADNLPIWFAGFKKIFGQHGILVTNHDIATRVLGDWEGPARLGITDSEEYFRELENEVIEKLNHTKLNEGALETLKKIKEKGGKIAVITTSKKRWVKGGLRNNGLRDLVDVFLGREDVTFVKPDPEGLIKALRLMGGNPLEAIMIGDTGKDVVAGRAAGADTGLYFPKRYEEFYNREDQESLRPSFVIEDFTELEKFV